MEEKVIDFLDRASHTVHPISEYLYVGMDSDEDGNMTFCEDFNVSFYVRAFHREETLHFVLANIYASKTRTGLLKHVINVALDYGVDCIVIESLTNNHIRQWCLNNNWQQINANGWPEHAIYDGESDVCLSVNMVLNKE
jgi:hypothetical protein